MPITEFGRGFFCGTGAAIVSVCAGYFIRVALATLADRRGR